MHISRLRLAIYAFAILFGILTALPNVLPPRLLAALPDIMPRKQVTLGLDLRGGSHLVLEVDASGLVREHLQGLVAQARTQLRGGKIPMTIRRTQNAVIVTVQQMADAPRALTLLKELAAPVGSMGGTDIEFSRPSPAQIVMTLNADGVKDRINAATEQSLEIIRRRIDQIGVAEPTIQRVGADRILVQLPGVQDPTRIRQMLGSTAKVNFHLMGDGGIGSRTLPGSDDNQRYTIQDQVAMAGDRLSDARAGFDQQGRPAINFRLDTVGARQFADITRNNVGRPFAIVLDDKVLSAPTINEPIPGGSGIIMGSFTTAQATDLAALLRAGALPAPLTVIEERTLPARVGRALRLLRGTDGGLPRLPLVQCPSRQGLHG